MRLPGRNLAIRRGRDRLQRCHCFGLGKGQAGRQALGLAQGLTRLGQIALARVQLALHIVGLGALGVCHQHLLDHDLGLVELAGLGSGIHLVHGGLLLGLGETGQADAEEGGQQQPADGRKQREVTHGHSPFKNSEHGDDGGKRPDFK